MSDAETRNAIRAAIDRFDDVTDGSGASVKASAAGVLRLRILAALDGRDWRVDDPAEDQ